MIEVFNWNLNHRFFSYLSNGYTLLALTPILVFVALSLATSGCIALGSWERAGRKFFIATGFVLILAILLHLLCTQSEFFYLGLGNIRIFETRRIIVDDSLGNNYIGYASSHLNTGFYLAAAGVVLAFSAWRHPKWLHLPVDESRAHKAKWIRWLNISEREKLATLFLSSLLMSYMLVFLMVFVF